jgi:site-specific recombinase XerC
MRTMPQDLVFCTTKGTPLSPKNLYNRVLAPACDNAKLPRVSWHSFRHGNATLLGEVGESIKWPRRFWAIQTWKQLSTAICMQFPTRSGVRSIESQGFCSQMCLN